MQPAFLCGLCQCHYLYTSVWLYFFLYFQIKPLLFFAYLGIISKGPANGLYRFVSEILIVPFIIEDSKKLFYYRGLSEWEREKGYLTDTCLDGQDTFRKLMSAFDIQP